MNDDGDEYDDEGDDDDDYVDYGDGFDDNKQEDADQETQVEIKVSDTAIMSRTSFRAFRRTR